MNRGQASGGPSETLSNERGIKDGQRKTEMNRGQTSRKALKTLSDRRRIRRDERKKKVGEDAWGNDAPYPRQLYG